MRNKQDLKLRIRTAIGHMKGIEKMIDDDKYCIDIINQISAVQASMRKISDHLLEDHLHSCVSHAIKKGNEEEILAELMEVLKHHGGHK